MAPRLFTVFCFAALGQLLGLHITAELYQYEPITISIINEDNKGQQTYEAFVRPGSSLLGVLRSLEKTWDLKFTVTEDPDYGYYYIESINGVAASKADHTYWQILSDTFGTPTPISKGVACYIPKPTEYIILKFIKW